TERPSARASRQPQSFAKHAGGRGFSSLSPTQPGFAGGEPKDLPGTPGCGHCFSRGKKTAEAIRQEVTREVDQLLLVIFNGRRKTGRLDLEAIEMVVRSAMHQAGAAALTELLHFPTPTADQRTLPCSCG